MNQNQEDRHIDGRFKAGHKRVGGRQLGSLNKWSEAKDQWLDTCTLPLDVLDLTEEERALAVANGIVTAGGWQLYVLMKNEPFQFYKLGIGFAPRVKLQESRSVSMDLSSIATSDLLAVLGLSAIEQAEVDEGE